MAAARQRNFGGSGTVRETQRCMRFQTPSTPDVRVFILGQGRRDNSVNSIVVIGSDGVARSDVHRGRRCAATANDNANGDTDNIVC